MNLNIIDFYRHNQTPPLGGCWHLLQAVPNAIFAHSVEKKLNCGYSGNVVRIRKDEQVLIDGGFDDGFLYWGSFGDSTIIPSGGTMGWVIPDGTGSGIYTVDIGAELIPDNQYYVQFEFTTIGGYLSVGAGEGGAFEIQNAGIVNANGSGIHSGYFNTNGLFDPRVYIIEDQDATSSFAIDNVVVNEVRDFTMAEILAGDVETWLDGSDGYVVAVYDKTGNGFAAEQLDASLQPLWNGDNFIFNDTYLTGDYDTPISGDFAVFFKGTLIDSDIISFGSPSEFAILVAGGSLGGNIRIGWNTSSPTVLTATGYPSGTEMKILITRIGTTISLYINGSFINSSTSNTSFDLSSDYILGGEDITPSGEFKTLVLWDRAVSEGERNNIFSSLT